jgi:hypothetical protein
MALYLSVITSYVLKWQINPISNPNPRPESLIHVAISTMGSLLHSGRTIAAAMISHILELLV